MALHAVERILVPNRPPSACVETWQSIHQQTMEQQTKVQDARDEEAKQRPAVGRARLERMVAGRWEEKRTEDGGLTFWQCDGSRSVRWTNDPRGYEGMHPRGISHLLL